MQRLSVRVAIRLVNFMAKSRANASDLSAIFRRNVTS
jgi:hypothetical protein